LEEFEKLTKQGSIEDRKQTLVFTHSQVISTILSYGLTNLNLNIINLMGPDEDEYLRTFFHLSNCSITCIDIDEDRECNVQTVNYTKHLNACTGQHSPFV
jgi:broad specificity phosphatase PhoE